MKYIFYTLLSLVLLSACETIEDRDALGPLAATSELHLTAVNTTTVGEKKGNEIAVNNTSAGVGGQWNLLVKISTQSQDTVVVPFLGKLPFAFVGTSSGGLVYDTMYVQVDTLDHPVNPLYTKLAGTDASGKTWVWAIDNNYTSPQRIWGNGGRNDDAPYWWGLNYAQTETTAADQKVDFNGSMKFDLNGAANFSETEFGTTKKGSFSFDFTKKKTAKSIGQITLSNATILHGISQNDGQKIVYTFEIIKLTDDELVLEYPTDSNDYEGWFWVFKREGYTYP